MNNSAEGNKAQWAQVDTMSPEIFYKIYNLSDSMTLRTTVSAERAALLPSHLRKSASRNPFVERE